MIEQYIKSALSMAYTLGRTGTRPEALNHHTNLVQQTIEEHVRNEKLAERLKTLAEVKECLDKQ